MEKITLKNKFTDFSDNQKNSDLKKNTEFAKKFYAMGYPNPLGKGVVFTLRDESGDEGMVLVELRPMQDAVHITEIHVLEGKTGMGYGDYIMSELTKLADEYGVTLSLFPVPLEGAGKSIPKSKLIQFYKKHGFVSDSDNYEMERPPRGR